MDFGGCGFDQSGGGPGADACADFSGGVVVVAAEKTLLNSSMIISAKKE